MLLAKRHLLLPETLPHLGDLDTLHLGESKKLHQRHPAPLTTPYMSVHVRALPATTSAPTARVVYLLILISF